MQYCVECGQQVRDDETICHDCYYGCTLLSGEVELYQDPVMELGDIEEPCDHEMIEISGGMAMCIHCGAIED